MAIEVLFHGLLKQYFKENRIEEDNLSYPCCTSVSVGDLIENIGISSRSISFVVINKKRYPINNVLLDMHLRTGDCIEIFPNIAGG